MKDKKAAEHYAIGFMQAIGKESLPNLLKEVRTLQNILSDNPEINSIFASVLVKQKDKLEIIEPFTTNSEYKIYWQNLIMLLHEKTRLNLFAEIINFLELYILEELNIVKVTIKTAHEASEQLKAKMVKYLTDNVKATIEANFEIDPSVIGGFIAESDNFIVDSSVKYSLEKFRLSVMNL